VILHDGLMYVSLVLLVGHLYLALIHPATRHALRGMTLGDVRVEWAMRHHAKWEPEGVHVDRPRIRNIAQPTPQLADADRTRR
jgi:cytochrome b subunit of formate dehydrogenase